MLPDCKDRLTSSFAELKSMLGDTHYGQVNEEAAQVLSSIDLNAISVE